VNSLSYLPPPRPWRSLLFAVAVLLGIGATTVWTWYMLTQRQQHEYQHRFALNVQALGEIATLRMNTYETVLHGVSSAFSGNPHPVTWAQWNDIMAQMQVQQTYPSIGSVAWSRAVRADQLDDFLAFVRTDGRPDYQMFPAGSRAQYLPVQYISPINGRTRSLTGLDLLTQEYQRQAIDQAVDEGHAVLSEPLPDLYPGLSDLTEHVGLIMYLPVYQTGMPSETAGERRASLLGVTHAAFHGSELAEKIFGSRLRLFHIVAYDFETGRMIFDSQLAQSLNAPPGWQSQLSGQVDLPLYGRIWRLNISSTPEYERALLSHSPDLILLIGLSTAFLVALLAGVCVYQHDRQMYASQRVEVTLREQADQLILANRYKSEFLANMSHELRTPLNSILILSDQMRQNVTGGLGETHVHHAEIVYRAGNELLQLINDVLDLAKIEAGRVQLNMEPLNMQNALIDLDAAMRPLAEAKKIHLHIPQLTPDSGVPLQVYTDRMRLHQILRNLISNAIKFTDEGQVQLNVSAGDVEADGRVLVHFAVSDTGIGIDPAHHGQIFEAFRQLDGSTHRRFTGTGLGLAITRQLVLALGGDITLNSALGKGATFMVSLPMQNIVFLPKVQTEPPQRSGQGPALLIVEDDAGFADVIITQAHGHGFSSVHCLTGEQALEVLGREAIAAIILDIILPDISGWQLYRRLRALPAHQRTPVHIISCLPQPATLENEGTHYLTKPISHAELEQVFTFLQQDWAQGPTLLLVEDDDAEREHYCQRLGGLGFVVTACNSAHDACELWTKTAFKVVVLDLNLPDGDGFGLLDSLDKLRRLQGVRVVVNTGLDVTQEGLQRLCDYSAVVVHKHGDDTEALEQAVQGFLMNLDQTGTDGNGCAPVKPVSSALQGRHVLLVDDDVRNIYAMTALLDGLGIRVSTAGNGEEAIAAFKQTMPDLILMDMSMPVMDGDHAIPLLKTRHGCTIPIIALTARAMKDDREKCLAVGADDYIAKPINRESLRILLERWLLGAAEQAEQQTDIAQPG